MACCECADSPPKSVGHDDKQSLCAGADILGRFPCLQTAEIREMLKKWEALHYTIMERTNVRAAAGISGSENRPNRNTQAIHGDGITCLMPNRFKKERNEQDKVFQKFQKKSDVGMLHAKGVCIFRVSFRSC